MEGAAPRRLACVDVGSNTITLVIAESREGGWVPLHQDARITRLGAGLDRSGRLDPERLGATLSVLGEMADQARRLGAGRLRGVATAAAREARDGGRLVEEARRVGADLEIVDGETEAALVWLASWQELGEAGRPLAVVDIGGRSTEIIVGSGPEPDARVSLPVGAVRLTEACVEADPPGEAAWRCVAERAAEALAKAPTQDGARLIAVAGTATTLAAIHLRLTRYDPERVHGLRIDRDALEGLTARLWSLDLESRRALPGMEPGRADVLPAGATVLCEALARAGATDVTVSDRGVRWGLLYRLAGAPG
jgi:exopolyphosphatase / guanosine-5'-triphosphate,3'-diphosphate pyrophosphatase